MDVNPDDDFDFDSAVDRDDFKDWRRERGRPIMKPDANLPIGMVQIGGCRCRCGHEWRSFKHPERPVTCPRCNAMNWDKPYKKKAEHDRPGNDPPQG